jgi:AbrB family looped-hinge helix DNA binding protein
MAHAVGEKGQIVIEKPIRDALGVRPGSLAVQTLRGDHVEIRFFPPEHTRSLKGALARFVKRSLPPEEWEEARQRAWKDAVSEEWDREE